MSNRFQSGIYQNVANEVYQPLSYCIRCKTITGVVNRHTESVVMPRHKQTCAHKGARSTSGSQDASTTGEKQKQKRRCKPGTRALRDIRKQQKGTGLLMRKLPFRRRVRKIAGDISSGLNSEQPRFQDSTLKSLQVVTEAHLIKCLQNTLQRSLHAGRVTCNETDFVSTI